MSDLMRLAHPAAATPKTGHPHPGDPYPGGRWPGEVWPGVSDPAALLAAIADWLAGYGNHATRRTYAEGLGLPVSTADLAAWISPRAAAPRAGALNVTAPHPGGPANTPRTSHPHPKAPHTDSPCQAPDRTAPAACAPGPTAPGDGNRSTPPGPTGPGDRDSSRGHTTPGNADRRTSPGSDSPHGPDSSHSATADDTGHPSSSRHSSPHNQRSSHSTTPDDTDPATSRSTGNAGPTDPGRTTAGPETEPATEAWREAVLRYAEALRLTAPTTRAPAPPPAPRGRLRTHHWFRWCVARGLDPTAATSADVKAWLDALATASAAPATRDRMLATVKALYGYLADLGVVAGNPAALNRRRLGLTAAASSTSGTVTLTTRQVRALYAAAGTPRRGASPVDTARALAVVALFTLGLRVSELCGLDRADLHVTRGRRALRVLGKGGKTRVVYLSAPAEQALLAYLKVRDAATASRENAVERRTRDRQQAASPLLETRTGNRYQRQAIWQLLRRVTANGGPELEPVAGAMHPHALRHFYVTTAVEAGAQLVHVQADVGHSSIDTTQQTYDHAARAPERSAVDLVASSWFEPQE